MNKNERLKIVRRIGMPETNSSSSHAVSISMSTGNLVCPGDNDWDIEITEDGVLRIPRGKDFGWEYFKTNSVLTKLQYLCGIYCYDIRSDSGKKSIVKLKKILKQIFGVRDVEFLWITEFSKRLKEVDDPDEAYYDYPEIDHNSHDIFEEITENISVIRAFLLSRDSWLYGGNDNSSPPSGFYNEPIKKSRVNAILSIDLGGKYGRVDWEVKDLFNNVGKDMIKRALTNDDEFNILGEIFYNIETKTWEENEKDLKEFVEGSLLSFFDFSLYYNNQKFYVLFTNHEFNNDWMNFKKDNEKEDWTIITAKTVNEKVEGTDYIMFPICIKLLDYNGYEI